MSRTVKDESVVETQRADSPEKKMGLNEYLRKHPQDAITKKLMKTYLGSKIMTEVEWDAALEELLNRTITH